MKRLLIVLTGVLCGHTMHATLVKNNSNSDIHLRFEGDKEGAVEVELKKGMEKDVALEGRRYDLEVFLGQASSNNNGPVAALVIKKNHNGDDTKKTVIEISNKNGSKQLLVDVVDAPAMPAMLDISAFSVKARKHLSLYSGRATPYQVFGLAEDATMKEVQAAYDDLMQEMNERAAKGDKVAQEVIQMITMARNAVRLQENK